MQIMVVDDDAVSRLALIDLLQKMDFTDIVECQDGQAAWEYLEKSPVPVLCCCDVRMPRMTGIDLLEKIRQHDALKSMSFVLITSGSDRDIVQQAIMLGVAGYIVKPFNANEAATKLNDILGNEWKNIAEDPLMTAKRLSISGAKLSDYYGAFNAQIDQLISASEAGDQVVIENLDCQIDGMQTGCLTLGLWHCSRELDRLKSMSNRLACLAAYMLSVKATVDYQRSRLRG